MIVVRRVVQCGHFSDKENSADEESALFGAKHFGFFKIYGVSARTREGGGSSSSANKGGEVNFSRFCHNVFYGRLQISNDASKTFVKIDDIDSILVILMHFAFISNILSNFFIRMF